MRRKRAFCAVSVFVTCLLGLALAPSWGRADDVLSLGQPTEAEGVVVVLDDAEGVDPEALDEDVSGAPDDIVVLPEDAEKSTEAAVLVSQDAGQNTQVDELEATDEVRETTEVAAPALTAQASTDVNDLLANVTNPTVMYRTHVQTYGWQAYQSNGKMSGTSGESKRLEAIELVVKVPGVSGGIAYRVHRQTYGWESGWKKNGATSGTVGESKRLEGIMIKLTGDLAKQYDVQYRVHVQTYGWQDWVQNGELAGTTGESKRLEAIQIKLVAKESASQDIPPAPVENNQQELKLIEGSLVDYNVHVQTHGWSATVADGASAGTTGEGKRLEGIQIKLGPGVQGGIQYCTHVETYGWEQSWMEDGAMSGTLGESKRLEAIRIQLTGDAAKNYDVWYRVHAQTYGWLGWATNGESAGTAGRSKRLEAIEIKLLPKDSAAPGTTLRHFIQSSLIYLDAGHGLSGTSGDDPGSAGNGYVEADLTKDLVNRVADYTLKKYGITVYNNVDCDVRYAKRQEHAQSVGATAYVSVHFNAAGSSATGFESYIFKAEPGYSGEAAPRSKELQNIIHPKIVKALGIRDRGRLGAAYSVVNGAKTGIPAVLLEVCFITNAQDMRTYINKKAAVVQAIAEGIYEATQQGF